MNNPFKTTLPIALIFVTASCGMMKSSEKAPFEGTLTYTMDVQMEGDAAMMADQIKAMLPEDMVLGTNGSDFGIKMNGGMQAMHMVANSEEKMMYIAAQGEFMKQPFPEQSEEPDTSAKPVVTKLEETKEILGFVCQGYSLEMGQEGEGTMILYTTEDINLVMPDALNDGGTGTPFSTGGLVPGTALYIEQHIDQGMFAFDLVFEAINIVEGAEAAADVITPTEGDYELMETEEMAE